MLYGMIGKQRKKNRSRVVSRRGNKMRYRRFGAGTSASTTKNGASFLKKEIRRTKEGWEQKSHKPRYGLMLMF